MCPSVGSEVPCEPAVQSTMGRTLLQGADMSGDFPFIYLFVFYLCIFYNSIVMNQVRLSHQQKALVLYLSFSLSLLSLYLSFSLSRSLSLSLSLDPCSPMALVRASWLVIFPNPSQY